MNSSMHGWRTGPDDACRAAARRHALTYHCDAAREVRAAVGVTPAAETPLYEPSQPAPKTNRIVVGLAMIGVGVLMVMQGIRRLRSPWATAALCLIVVAVAVLATCGGR